MHVDVDNQQNDLQISTDRIVFIARSVVSEENQKYDEVAIHFVTREAICSLHSDHFNDPSPTDCISFPVVEEDPLASYRLLGDVFVCPSVAKEYAEQHNKNPYEELTLYIVHGLLHLLGYDDLEEKERTRMRAAEKRHMDILFRKGYRLYP